MEIELIELIEITTESLDYITGEKSTEITKLWKLDIDSEIYERFLNKNGVSWTWARSITGTPTLYAPVTTGSGTYTSYISSTNTASTYTQQKYSESQLESFFKNLIRTKKLERVV